MAETWVLNATVTLPSSSLSGTFTSNGKSFTGIRSRKLSSARLYLYYTSGAGGTTDSTQVYENGSWINDAYRTLVFDTAPTGAMLTWLQANGQKQSEPEPETPANVCLVNGTAYGVKTGQTLVNGAAQTIYNGRTLVGGTGYDIVLSTSGFTVTITGNGMHGSAVRAAVDINGTTYTSAATVEVESGTTIMLRTDAASTRDYTYTKITIDGVTVAKGTSSETASYNYTVNKNIAVELRMKDGLSSRNGVGIIDVTTS